MEDGAMTPLHRGFGLRGARGLAPLLACAALLGAACAAPATSSNPTAAPRVASPAAPASVAASPSLSASLAPSLAVTIKADATAADSGVHDALVARKLRFEPATLSAPADKVWHIDFDQADDKIFGTTIVKHDVAIAAGVSKPAPELTFEDRIFESKIYTLGKYTFDVGGLPAGAYTFWCTIHPNDMHGVLTIK
jgi:plastocyanin